ncbi:GmrSD restriction endonuclease domain-containing protein [Deinococcus sp. UYEF24]
MQAFVNPVLTLLNGKKQFVVPHYQRPYSWRLEQCTQLWQDIEELAEQSDLTRTHFMGSVVYVQDAGSAADGGAFQVIDGQQRLTTLTLLLSALVQVLRERETAGQAVAGVDANEMEDLYLNVRGKGDGRFKLLLTRSDRQTLMHALAPDQVPLPTQASERVMQNRDFFLGELRELGGELVGVVRALGRLMVVDISLVRPQDNPQLIFESLNSTGLDLTQADLTRNYVLMSLTGADQESLYDHFWHPMERLFIGPGKEDNAFDFFMRDYLTVRGEMAAQPPLKKVYAAFKKHVSEKELAASMSEVVRDMYRAVSFYSVLTHPEQEENPEVRRALTDLHGMELDVWLPLGLYAYEAWKSDKLKQSDLLGMLRLVESYLFRRWASGVPSQGLNKVFPSVLPQFGKGDDLGALRDFLYQLPGTRRFPQDEEFRAGLTTRDLYSARSWSRYTLGKLENHDHKEAFSDLSAFTIEHILPQNKKLSPEWQAMLGEDWQVVQDKYLHTLGNLTLTGYNSELSDKPFTTKQDMTGGFRDSHLRLNNALADLEVWNETELLKRAGVLADLAVQVWPAVQPTTALVERLASRQAERSSKSVEDFLRLASPTLRELFEEVREGLVALSPDVQEQATASYVAYKVGTNFCDVLPQSDLNVLKCWLNLPYTAINDPQELVRDVSKIGHAGNGEVEVTVRSLLDVPAVLELAQQALSYQLARQRGVEAALANLSAPLSQVYAALEARVLALGPGVTLKRNKAYLSFREKKAFCELDVRVSGLLIRVLAGEEELPAGDTGQWEPTPWKGWQRTLLKSEADLKAAWPAIEAAYESQREIALHTKTTSRESVYAFYAEVFSLARELSDGVIFDDRKSYIYLKLAGVERPVARINPYTRAGVVQLLLDVPFGEIDDPTGRGEARTEQTPLSAGHFSVGLRPGENQEATSLLKQLFTHYSVLRA